jgi:ribulose-phosphate 3-epimerase
LSAAWTSELDAANCAHVDQEVNEASVNTGLAFFTDRGYDLVMDNKPRVRISASILSADFARLGEQVLEAERAGVDSIHVDVMDGRFVPNITIGPLVVRALRRVTSLPLPTHLMIVEPERYIEDFVSAGSDGIFVHQETCPHLHRTIQLIKSLGAKAGVAVNPASPITLLDEVLEYLDMVLVMTVNPGFGGQAFIPSTLGKIRQLRTTLEKRGLEADIIVDGGINTDTARLVVEAGANVLGAGSAIFGTGDTVAEAVRRLRRSIED